MKDFKIPNTVSKKLSHKIKRNYVLKFNEKKLSGKFDLLIINSGFESRTTGAVKSLTKLVKTKNTIVFIYHPRESKLYIKNLENLGKVRQLANSVSENSIVKEIDPTDPWSFRRMMKEICQEYKISTKSRIIVDITSFTRVFIYELIYGLYKTGCTFFVLYTEPEDYSKILPTGLNKIIVSPSFIGKPRPNKKVFLLVFFGWETDRTRGVFENFNSDKHLGVLGIAPIDIKHIKWQRESKERNEDLMKKMKAVDCCSTLDLKDILQFLKKKYNKTRKEFTGKRERFYFSITGLGPKVQNVASCLFAMKNKDVQLIYGTPAYWGPTRDTDNSEPVESYGIGETYLYGPFSKKIIKMI